MNSPTIMPKRVRTVLSNFQGKLANALILAKAGKASKGDIGTMMLCNVAFLCEFTNLAMNGEYEKAADIMYEIDTTTRDAIPLTVYDWINHNFYETSDVDRQEICMES